MVSADDLAERIAAFLDRHRYIVLLTWSIWFAVPTAMRAAAKPFWHDEIYTLLLARLPSISVHWSALRDGVDFAPPLNGFATRAVRHVAGIGPVAARLPAMIGFWTMAMVIFAVVRERAGAIFGFAAICLPMFTAAYRYSYEARPYGLMMGLASLAWFAWMALHITVLIGFRNRLAVLSSWIYSYVFFRRASRLITRAVPPEQS